MGRLHALRSRWISKYCGAAGAVRWIRSFLKTKGLQLARDHRRDAALRVEGRVSPGIAFEQRAAGRNSTKWSDKIKEVNYEQFKGYIDQIKEGKHNILWKGRPIYLAKTSGTTSGTKYIPITKIRFRIISILPAMRCFAIWRKQETLRFADGKADLFSGSPELERVGGIPTGRLSGIVNHHVPEIFAVRIKCLLTKQIVLKIGKRNWIRSLMKRSSRI